MKYKIALLVILLGIILYQGFTICDRIQTIDGQSVPTKIDSFIVFKRVNLKLRSMSFLRFADKKICIMVNGGTVVFLGTYEELLKTKVPLPEPTCHSTFGQQQYYVGVHIYDLDKQIVYKWDSDGCDNLDESMTNRINLRYTGSEEESITLDVDQI